VLLNEFKNINYFPHFSTFSHVVDNFSHNWRFLAIVFEYQQLKYKLGGEYKNELFFKKKTTFVLWIKIVLQ